MAQMFRLVRVQGPDLPPGFATMDADARAEGHRIPARVVREWDEGMRFDRAGETLLAAYDGPELAGIGGLTHDPDWPDALRLRRFYVRPAYRRLGLARRIAGVLLTTAAGRVVMVHAGTADAPAFWEALGFLRDERLGLHRAPAMVAAAGQPR